MDWQKQPAGLIIHSNIKKLNKNKRIMGYAIKKDEVKNKTGHENVLLGGCYRRRVCSGIDC